ncbi:MAG: signal peptidase II [Calditerricola sp.]|nr:signal peptidase II [Bacillota bacterium]MCG0313585.1 signal peptidase II [Calditerricola sp.]
MWPYVVAASVLAVDQLTKWAVIRFMEIGESIPIWDGVFHLTSHRNRGAAFGILQGQRWLFVLIAALVVIALAAYLPRVRRDRPLGTVALALLLGGALGNLVDRIRFGEVVDFLDVRLINYPIFNVADSAIVIAGTLLLWDMWRTSRKATG